MAVEINQDNVVKEIGESQKPVIMEVYASWCGPCKQMMPIFEELEKELKDKYTFAKLNVDNARDISIQYGVTSVPTFVFIKNSKVLGKETGYIAKDDLKAKIEAIFG